MANPTTNYGFVLPTSSDLVTDLPADFDIALQGVDTRLKALQPGTTLGDLAYSSATANTNTRLGIGSTGQVLTVSGGVPTWATASTGSSNVAGKNAVINSAFDTWQRSTSATFNNTLSYPAADRWYGVSLGGGPTCTMSRQTADTTGLTYGMRYGRNSGQTATGDIYVGNTFESINSKQFAGQTVTLSFYAKKGADAPSTLVSQIRTGTGTDQASSTLFSTGWTGGANNSQSNTITSTMTRYTYTVTLGSTVNQIMVAFSYSSTGTAGSNEWFQIEGVQLEIASSATAFSRNASTAALELAACQRYYYKDTKAVLRADQTLANSIVYGVYYLPQEMRTTPTLTQTGGATETSNTSATTFSNDGSSSNTRKTGIYITGGASTGTVYMYRSAEWSAEL